MEVLALAEYARQLWPGGEVAHSWTPAWPHWRKSPPMIVLRVLCTGVHDCLVAGSRSHSRSVEGLSEGLKITVACLVPKISLDRGSRQTTVDSLLHRVDHLVVSVSCGPSTNATEKMSWTGARTSRRAYLDLHVRLTPSQLSGRLRCHQSLRMTIFSDCVYEVCTYRCRNTES
jgi:hypothetical protein